MRRPLHIAVLALALLGADTVRSQEYRYALGLYGGEAMISGGNFFAFKNALLLGGEVRYHPGGRWFVGFDYTRFSSKNDEGKDSTSVIEAIRNNAPLRFRSRRIGVSLGRYLLDSRSRVNLSLSLDAGLMMWRVDDPVGDTTVHVRGAHNENTPLASSELTVGGSLGISSRLSRTLRFSLSAGGTYLTGAGAEFAPAVQTARDRWIITARAGLQLHFGKVGDVRWPSDSAWGVPKSPAKSRTKGQGQLDPALLTDSDRDGVVDAYDDCPGTFREAVGFVDVNGCPADADHDGVSDYLDHCPGTPTGALVSDDGCPVDSDGDGVPDGVDDCPDSPIAVPVDRYGCIDLSMFSKPMILRIDYLPGSFEIDLKTKDRLKKIAGILLLVPEVKLDVVGYTDNIGLPDANQKLSEKRARRVRDYLVAMGVASGRIKAVGKGEDNQIAPNTTAEGRSQNRRIEITFYR
ncbi:MAG: OmpA family protein [candidate division Zixibacteria bacterium]|nr:OmpA family protein [candidate division Zixibacteria bacterium]